MKVFKKIDGTKIPDVVKYTLDIINKNPNVSIHIGTDSQNIEDVSVYVTAIAYRFGNNGVHYIYHKERIPRINDIWTRLWQEAVRTIELAQWMNQKASYLKLELDLDYNNDKFRQSNQLISATKGWAESLGYKTNIKPQLCIAIRASDYHCR